MDSIVRQWIERAEYDLETACSLLKSRRYLYVAFMCQQCLEKMIKGFMVSKGMTPLFIHNLVRLAQGADVYDLLPEKHRQLLARLNPYYIKARYGEYKESLSQVCTSERAKEFLDETEALVQWLKAENK